MWWEKSVAVPRAIELRDHDVERPRDVAEQLPAEWV